ncbi:hypothetical protein IAU60_002537 [Kwoniella sp. DSM 27419]
MSNTTNVLLDFQSAPLNAGGQPTAHVHQEKDEKAVLAAQDEIRVSAATDVGDTDVPTEEELSTLRKVASPMPWVAVAMCLVELAERASYYGCKEPFGNFIRAKLPEGGNGAGAVAPGALGANQTAGALGLGSVTASAITTLFTFLAYVIPIYGGIVADTKWGRFKTICIGTAVGGLAHIILVIPAIPKVIANPNGSLAAFIISILVLAGAAGFIKPSLGPLLCDQIPVRQPTISVTKSGERVIIDPQVTVERWLLIFYWCINVGAFFAIATSYSARFVGFWLAFLLPGLIYFLMPVILVLMYKRLYKAPAQGSVVVETIRVFRYTLKDGGWGRLWKGGDEFWDRAKPSHMMARDGTVDTSVVFWDDKFVDEIRQSLAACVVFMLCPVFALSSGGIGNSLNSMSAGMRLDGVPNDLLNNFNPLAIIIAAPLLNYGLYPFMARMGRPLKPMTRMAIGFLLGTIGCIIAALVQWRIYVTSPCGYRASTCVETIGETSPVSLWWQIPIYFIPAVGEIFVNVTSYELAYTRSPARMKGLVYSMALFNTAIASAISLAMSNAIQDPYLIWPWVALAVATFLGAILLKTKFRHLDLPVEDFANKERQEGKQQPGSKGDIY